MKDIIEKFDIISTDYWLAYSARRMALYNIVNALQDKLNVDYITFSDTTSYPRFHDECIDEYDTIIAVKAENSLLYFIGESQMVSKEEYAKNWFNPNLYGSFDVEEFATILTNVAKEHNLI